MRRDLPIRSFTISSVFTGVSMALMIMTAQAEEARVGVNAAIKGNVTIQSEDQKAKEAVLREPVFLGDKVNSQKLSSLQVLLVDETVFTVGPNCDMVIDEFIYDPKKNNNLLKVKVAKGMFRFTSGKISKSDTDAVSLETPVATLGIRGTIIEGLVGQGAIDFARQSGIASASGNVDSDGASLLVLRGPGAKNRSKNRRGKLDVSSGGETVTLSQSGMAVFVPRKDAPPSDPFLLSDVLFASFSDQLRTAPSAGSGYKPFNIRNSFGARTQSQPQCRGEECSKDVYDPSRGMPFPNGFEGVVCNTMGGCNPDPNQYPDPNLQ